jgi:secreted PhoX family phosphatase
MIRLPLCAAVLATLALAPAAQAAPADFGARQEQLLQAQSIQLFGFNQPIEASATAADYVPREDASAADRQLLAHGLIPGFVTRKVGGLADMIAFWPDDVNYSHVIVCNEWARSPGGVGMNQGRNPSVQRIDVNTGEVENILFGMSRCDGLRTTQWGTVLATEENGADGSAYEILDPLATTGCWVYDRGAAGADADIRSAYNDATADSCETSIRKRTALAAQSWEGLEALDSGVVIGGDELRTDKDNDGGAIFRFVPDTFYACEGAPVRPGLLCDNTIDSLDESPLVSGQNFALFHVCSGTDDYGQGCEYGDEGRWVAVEAATARFDANLLGATGYCRPEDLHVDRSYGMFAGGEGIRWCWTNTCGGSDGEALCVIESDAAVSARDQVQLNIGGEAGQQYFLANGSSLATADTQRFVESDAEMQSHDNLDIQPFTSNVYLIEDYNEIEDGGTGGDVWACLPDGTDRDERTDGCVKVLSVVDPESEPSGFIFDGTGETAYYHVQHGEQPAELLDYDSNPMNGQTDDLIRISGFKVKK